MNTARWWPNVPTAGVRAACIPASDAVVAFDLKRPMLPAQGRVVAAAAEDAPTAEGGVPVLRVRHGQELDGRLRGPRPLGEGKTYRAIVMCPPHLVETTAGRGGEGLPGWP